MDDQGDEREGGIGAGGSPDVPWQRKRDGGFVGKNDFLSTLLSLPKEERLADSDLVAILWVSTLST